MTFKKAILWLFLVAIAPIVTSCNLESDAATFHFVNLQVVEAELPESFQLYETYEVNVTYLRPNGCTFFEGFDISKAESTERYVVVIGSEFDNTSCTQVAEQVVDSFSFTCYYEGTYTFRFWTGEDENGNAEFIEYDVPVIP